MTERTGRGEPKAVALTGRRNDIHIVPVGQGRSHEPNESCWCGPTKDAETAGVRPQGPFVWIHNLEN